MKYIDTYTIVRRYAALRRYADIYSKDIYSKDSLMI